MTKRTDLDLIWADLASADNVVSPNAAKFRAGWVAELPPFEYFNFLQQKFSEAIQHINQFGISQWDNTTVYTTSSLVRSVIDGQLYTSAIANNVNREPSASAAWDVFPPPFVNEALSGLAVDTSYFRTSRTYVPAENVIGIEVTVIGGGGGGGGLNVSSSGGDIGVSVAGSAGGMCIRNINGSNLAESYNIVVGAGGNGGNGNSSGAGGSRSTFIGTGVNMIANGGAGGVGSFTAPEFNGPISASAGGTATGGQLNLTGQRATQGYRIQNDSLVPSYAASTIYGSGGDSRAGNGLNATGIGSGGGGCQTQARVQPNRNLRGGSGSSGGVIIKEFLEV